MVSIYVQTLQTHLVNLLQYLCQVCSCLKVHGVMHYFFDSTRPLNKYRNRIWKVYVEQSYMLV